MKKILSLVVATVMAASSLTAVSFAAETAPEVTVIVNDAELTSDQPAVIVEDRTMVPIRAIAEALLIDVAWDAVTKTVTFENTDTKVTLTVGAPTLSVEKTDAEPATVAIDSPAIILNSRTLVPVRFVSDAFGAEVDWDGATRVVTITSETESTQPEGMADRELKDQVELIDSYVAILNDYVDDMSEEDAEAFAKLCDNVATVQNYLDTGKYTQDEFTASVTVVTEALDKLAEIASNLGVELDNSEETEASDQPEGMAYRELQDQADLADYYIGQLNEYADDMAEADAEIFAEVCDDVATVQTYLDTGKYTQDELTASEKAVTEGLDKLAKIALNLGVELVDPEDDNSGVELEGPTVEKIKELFERADKVCGIINDADVEVNEDLAEAYAEDCDTIATVGSIIGTTDLDEEKEISAAYDELSKAYKNICKFADDNGIDIEF